MFNDDVRASLASRGCLLIRCIKFPIAAGNLIWSAALRQKVSARETNWNALRFVPHCAGMPMARGVRLGPLHTVGFIA